MATRSFVVVGAVAAGLIGVAWYRRGHAPPVVAPARARLANQLVETRAVLAGDGAAKPSSAGGLRLEGQVIDADERPVGGVTVHLVDPKRSVRSDPDGSFAFAGLAAAPYTLYATHDELYADDVKSTLSATSDPVTLHARRAASAVVVVIDVDSGAPIEGATVGDDRHVATTDDEGRARLHGLPPGSIRLEVSAAEHGPVKLAVGADERAVEHTIKLARGAPVSGTVVDPSGAPVPRAEVELDGPGWTGSVRSNAAGAWRVPALARGKYFVTASSDTLGEAEPVMIKVDGMHPLAAVVVPVVLGAQITGTVVDPAGGPVAGARVLADSGSYEELATTSDASGRFSLLGVPVSSFQVWAASGRRASARIQVNFEEAKRVELRLVVDASMLAGIVVDRRGEPVSEAHVIARGGATVIEERTDANGHFELGAIPEGTYALWAKRPDGTAQSYAPVSAHTGDRAVTLVMP